MRIFHLHGLRVVALAWPLLMVGCGSPEGEGGPPPARAQRVEVTGIERVDLRETLRVVGSIAANESAEIRPEITGVIREVTFREGAAVGEGEPLLRLDDREVRAQIREAVVRLELARQTLARSDALLETRSIPQAERDRALAEYERVQAELDLLRVREERSTVRAPFAGVVGTRLVSPGDMVGPDDVITRIDDLSSLKIEFTVPERHAGRVGMDSPVLARTSMREGAAVVEGKVYFVSSSIDRSTRSIEVKALAGGVNSGLRPGTFIEVELVLAEKDNTLAVPESAILAREGTYFVVVVEPDGEGGHSAVLRPVALGIRERGRVEILPDSENPVREGDRVVAAGVGALPLFTGAPLEPVPMRNLPNGERRS